MTPRNGIAGHQELCDDLHHLALDENRFLRQHQRAPDPALLARKRVLLEKLDGTLADLRTLPAASVRDPDTRALLEKARTRILQIIQLDRENEQLLLRCSLANARPGLSTVPAGSASLLQKIYARCN